MIIFGTAITSPEQYEKWAEPGIRRVMEPDSKLFAHQTTGSLFRNYNLMLDLARDEPDLEALVIVHQDAELLGPDFCSHVREAMSDPDAAIAGCVGAIGVRSIAWWEGAVTWAPFIHRYEEIGGGDIMAMTFTEDVTPTFAGHQPGTDGVEGDAVIGSLDRDDLGQADHAVLGRDIGDLVRRWRPARAPRRC